MHFDTLHPSDYRVAERDFNRIFGGCRSSRQPWRLTGRNFMTPEVLGRVLDPDGKAVEISTGVGFRNDRLFGVTWDRGWDDPCDPRDGVFASLEQAYDHIFNPEEDDDAEDDD